MASLAFTSRELSSLEIKAAVTAGHAAYRPVTQELVCSRECTATISCPCMHGNKRPVKGRGSRQRDDRESIVTSRRSMEALACHGIENMSPHQQGIQVLFTRVSPAGVAGDDDVMTGGHS